jgi:predicted metal-binding membrane protein
VSAASPSVSDESVTAGSGLTPALVAARARLGLIALLLVLAALAWWFTATRMSGMDDGPGTALGPLGWFVGVWVVMMAAMMLPSVWPTVALYAQMVGRRARVLPLLFVAGYLLTWAGGGLLAFGVFDLGRALAGHELAWGGAGRWLAGSILVAAAIYELTPVKEACLAKCRSPLGFLLSSWRSGPWGALSIGASHGAWCVGCCWALMASLFALGVMSLAWMAVVAAIIALEKTVPGGRAATFATAAVLLALGVILIAAPGLLPLLTIPGYGGVTGAGHAMGMS